MVNPVSRDVEILHSKYFYLALIIIITSLLYLWPDFHPERIEVNDHKWFYDLIIHGGYFFVSTFLLLLIRLKYNIALIGLLFFLLSVLLELLQYVSYNRSVDIVDIGWNLTGIVLAVGAFRLVRAL